MHWQPLTFDDSTNLNLNLNHRITSSCQWLQCAVSAKFVWLVRKRMNFHFTFNETNIGFAVQSDGQIGTHKHWHWHKHTSIHILIFDTHTIIAIWCEGESIYTAWNVGWAIREYAQNKVKKKVFLMKTNTTFCTVKNCWEINERIANKKSNIQESRKNIGICYLRLRYGK